MGMTGLPGMCKLCSCIGEKDGFHGKAGAQAVFTSWRVQRPHHPYTEPYIQMETGGNVLLVTGQRDEEHPGAAQSA